MNAETTIRTYDQSAAALAEYFRGIGPRTDDIARALELAGTPTGAAVVEIGCGDGRDAAELLPRVASYEGYDPSEKMLELARAKLPGARFAKADALTYEYPRNTDVVLAFASLLHVSRNDMPAAFARIEKSLRPGGIAYISVKERENYAEEIKKDDHGERMFYLYPAALIKELAGTGFETAYEDRQRKGSTDWLTIAFRKLPG